MPGVLYALFGELPLTAVRIPLLLFIAFFSYVTAADSQTDAIGNLCTRGLTADSDLNAGMSMKVLRGYKTFLLSHCHFFDLLENVSCISIYFLLPALVDLFEPLLKECCGCVWLRLRDFRIMPIFKLLVDAVCRMKRE